MKNLCCAFLSIFLIGFLSNSIYSQSQYLVAKLDDPNVQMGPPGFTSNQSINNVLNAHGVYDYGPIFECFLNDYHHFFLNGNITSLISELDNYYSDFTIHNYSEAFSANPCNPCTPFNYDFGDPDYQNSYVAQETNTLCAWDVTTGNSNIKIAVSDLNFDPNATDANVNGTIFGSVPVPDPFPSGWNCFHGTNVISVVGAELDNGEKISGVCPDCTVDGHLWANLECRSGDWFSTLCALSSQYDIINVSAGFGDSRFGCPPLDATQQLRKDVIEKITSEGTLIVLAAGNNPENASHCHWADIPGVIVVSGSRQVGTVYEFNSSHARNQWVDLCAPSSEVPVVHHSENPFLGNTTTNVGTSFAAPQVAGTAGLMLSLQPCLSPSQVEAFIKETTFPHNENDLNNYNGEIGTGMLDVFAAVNAARGEFEPITEDRTWKFDHYLACDLIIKNGATLTIDGATVYIDDEVNIILQRGGFENNQSGAKLNLINGAKLTSTKDYCDINGSMWGGVMVEGVPDEDWNSGNQSKIFLQDAIIEDSKNGILMGYRFQNGLFLGGGRITSNNTQFLNNTVSIEFAEYIKDGGATFNNTDFFVNDDYLGEKFNEHVRLHNVKNIGFYNCEFRNDMSDLTPSIKGNGGGTGILAFDANFLVTDYKVGSLSYRSKFKNLQNGVRSLKSVTNNTFSIKHSDFEGVYNGVSAVSIQELTVWDCHFEFENRSPVDPITKTYQKGIVLNDCTGYTIAQNTFEEITDPLIDPTISNPDIDLVSTGTYIQNSKSEPNLVVDNTFIDCDNSNLAREWNRNAEFNNIGLEYLCNAMINNDIVDIGIITQSSNNNQGISSEQGRSNAPADNLFYPSSNFHIQTNNSTNLTTYFHNNGPFKEPTKISLGITKTEVQNGDGNCGLEPVDPDDPQPPTPCPNWETGCLGALYANLISERDDLKSTYYSLLDNNNTSDVLNNIEFGIPSEVIAQLNSIAPYVSNESLLFLMSFKDSRYSENEVAAVLAANPDVLRTNEIRHEVFINNTWSSSNLQLLNQVIATSSTRSVLERSISAKNKELVNLRRQVSKYYLKQENINYSFLTTWYGMDNTFANDLMVANNMFMQGQQSAGLNFLNGIDIDSYSSEIDQIDLDLIIQTKTLEMNVLDQYGINYYSMDQSIIDQLYTSAQNGNYTGGLHAANILEYFFDYDMETIPDFSDYFLPGTPQYKIFEEEKLVENKSIISPNPAKDLFTIDLSSFNTKVDIRIYNNMGELKKSYRIREGQFLEIRTSGIGSGLFYIEISPENAKKQVEKLIIL